MQTQEDKLRQVSISHVRAQFYVFKQIHLQQVLQTCSKAAFPAPYALSSGYECRVNSNLMVFIFASKRPERAMGHGYRGWRLFFFVGDVL